jgi:hypothetical protein
MEFKIGEKVTLVVGRPRKNISVRIVALNTQTGMPSKMRAVRRSEKLGKLGFFQEGEDWVKEEYNISPN